MLSHTISNYTIHRIKSSNIIKWLTVIQTKWEREREIERIIKRNTNRLRKWNKQKRELELEKMKTLEKRKKEKLNLIRNMYMEEIQK